MILKRFITILFTVLCLSILLSFSSKDRHKKLNAKLYYQWFKSSSFPFRDTIEKEGVKFVYEWVPREVEIARKLVSANISVQDAKDQLAKSESILTFKFYIILPKPGTDIFNYQIGEGEDGTTRTQYFSFDMQKDIHLNSKNEDSIDCNGFMHERGMSNFPISKFEFFFIEKDIDAVKSIYYFDRIYSKQNIEFNLTHMSKTKIPTLII